MEELKYYEFHGAEELNDHLKYWSNACGDLHHHGQYDLNDASELPEELQRAYQELWKEKATTSIWWSLAGSITWL